MIKDQPALLNVMGELDLRAQRDPATRSIVDRHAEGWRIVLGEVLRRGAAEETWTLPLDMGSAVELIIAVVKGVGRHPDRADDVLRQLKHLRVL
jgi:hypothetical protein